MPSYFWVTSSHETPVGKNNSLLVCGSRRNRRVQRFEVWCKFFPMKKPKSSKIKSLGSTNRIQNLTWFRQEIYIYITITNSGYFLFVDATSVDPTAASGAGCAHDMWSLGCLLATLYTGDRLFPVPKKPTKWGHGLLVLSKLGLYLHYIFPSCLSKLEQFCSLFQMIRTKQNTTVG